MDGYFFFPCGETAGHSGKSGRRRRGAFPERGNRSAHYLERGSAGAHFLSDKTARHTTWSGEAEGRISRAGEPLGTLLGAGKRRGAFPERQNRSAHYLERGSAGAHFPSDKTARHTTWSGEAQGRSFPDGEPSGTVAAEKREGAVWKQRGRTSEGGACGDLPLSWFRRLCGSRQPSRC